MSLATTGFFGVIVIMSSLMFIVYAYAAAEKTTGQETENQDENSVPRSVAKRLRGSWKIFLSILSVLAIVIIILIALPFGGSESDISLSHTTDSKQASDVVASRVTEKNTSSNTMEMPLEQSEEVNFYDYWMWFVFGPLAIFGIIGLVLSGGDGLVWVGRLLIFVLLFVGWMFIKYGPETPAMFTEWQSEQVASARQKDDEAIAGDLKTRSNTPLNHATWANRTSGAIPVGVWSKSVKPRPGCKVNFDGGNTVVYKVRTRLYNGDWSIHGGKGHRPTFTEFQFAALTEGLTDIPFTLRCP